jgi:hypothetical protein
MNESLNGIRSMYGKIGSKKVMRTGISVNHPMCAVNH